MQAIVSSNHNINIRSINGQKSFNHTMVNFPPHNEFTTFFHIDRSDINAREYGILSCFCVIEVPHHGQTNHGQTKNPEPDHEPIFGYEVTQALRSTQSSIRKHIFKTYETTIIGSILNRSIHTTHRQSAATNIKNAIQKIVNSGNGNTIIPNFELIIRQLPTNIPNQSTRIKTIQVICETNAKETLTKLLTENEIEPAHGLFAPFTAAQEFNTQYNEYILEHIKLIADIESFQVHGLHPDVLHSLSTNSASSEPTTIWQMLTNFPYQGDHTITPIDEISQNGLTGKWIFSAPRSSIETAKAYATHILTHFATKTRTYHHYQTTSNDFSSGITIHPHEINTNLFPTDERKDPPIHTVTTADHQFTQTKSSTKTPFQQHRKAAPQDPTQTNSSQPWHTSNNTQSEYSKTTPDDAVKLFTTPHISPTVTTLPSQSHSLSTHSIDTCDLKAQILSMKNEISRLNNTIETNEIEAQKKLNHTMKEYIKENEDTRIETQKLTDRVNQSTASYNAYKEQSTKTNEKIELLGKQHDELNDDYVELQSDHSILRAQHDVTLEELRELKKKNKASSAEAMKEKREATKIITALRAQLQNKSDKTQTDSDDNIDDWSDQSTTKPAAKAKPKSSNTSKIGNTKTLKKPTGKRKTTITRQSKIVMDTWAGKQDITTSIPSKMATRSEIQNETAETEEVTTAQDTTTNVIEKHAMSPTPETNDDIIIDEADSDRDAQDEPPPKRPNR